MENKKKFYKNKWFMFAILPLLLVSSVLAGTYLVHSINLTVDSKEAFVVQYSILGDAGNYNGELCSEVSEESWLTLENGATFDKDGFYPMESRKVCVRIQNLGEASIPYVIKSTTTGSESCLVAFPDVVKTGFADYGFTIDGQLVTIPADAPVVNDCNVNIAVSRGTLPSE
ncbi:MAG: hypothetical protein M0R17_10975 [Candidatus Omnitrophica bacterium]|jgi:hypothetical protein|nr:hypothetical protein [Candidatus Omnitrophota bacterium]